MRAGEIVAIAGVDGNGQTELIEAITGCARRSAGTVRVGGRDITGAGRASQLDAGVGAHRRGPPPPRPRARLHAGREPRAARLPRARALALGWLLAAAACEHARAALLGEFDVRGGGGATPAAALSGGNQQKVVIAREIACDPRVLVAAQPTRGLDVGAIEFVHRRLRRASATPAARVLLVSLELEEVASLADRILVIYEGRIVGEFARRRRRGGARPGDDGRRSRIHGRMSDGRSRRRRGRRSSRDRPPRAAACAPAAGGGVVAPLLTVAARVPGRRPRRARATGSEPDRDLQGDLRRHGPELVPPVDDGADRDARRDQPAADAAASPRR